jgi:hypothetical protein
VLLLHHIGRRSGEAPVGPLVYLEDAADRYGRALALRARAIAGEVGYRIVEDRARAILDLLAD